MTCQNIMVCIILMIPVHAMEEEVMLTNLASLRFPIQTMFSISFRHMMPRPFFRRYLDQNRPKPLCSVRLEARHHG